ncbi:MAG: hypothetical protein IJ094_12805 [Bacilli bacterium]|nr:hypothetical protein [Bacilli bacterium]
MENNQIITCLVNNQALSCKVIDCNYNNECIEVELLEKFVGAKTIVRKADIKENIIISEVDKVELLTNEVIKELKEVVFCDDIESFEVDNTNYITVEGTDKTIFLTIYNDCIVLETSKKGDIDEDGQQIYRNRTERKKVKGILKYIEKHYY